MNLTRIEREEMNSLSMAVFGKSSRWKKLIENGVAVSITEDVTESVPSDDGVSTLETKTVNKMNSNGTPAKEMKRHTVESIRTLMQMLKDRMDAYHAKLASDQAEKVAKEAQETLQKSVHEQLAGSAG